MCGAAGREDWWVTGIGCLMLGGGALGHPGPAEGDRVTWRLPRWETGKGRLQNPPLPLGGDLGEPLISGHPSLLSYQRDSSTKSTNIF